MGPSILCKKHLAFWRPYPQTLFSHVFSFSSISFSAGCFANTTQSQYILSGTAVPHISVAELDLLTFWTFLLPAFSSPCWTTPFTTLAATTSAGMVPLTHLAVPSHFCLLRYLHAVFPFPGSQCRNAHVGPRARVPQSLHAWDTGCLTCNTLLPCHWGISPDGSHAHHAERHTYAFLTQIKES